MHHPAKFLQTVERLQRYADWTVFTVAAVPHVGFDMQVLAVGAVSKPTLYRVLNCVKIDQTVAEISRFFWFSGRRLPPSWTFKNSNFMHVRCKGPMCVTLPNFVKIGLTAGEIWRFHGFFSKWRPTAILDLLGTYWDHPQWLIGGPYHCAKLGWNRWAISKIWNF